MADKYDDIPDNLKQLLPEAQNVKAAGDGQKYAAFIDHTSLRDGDYMAGVETPEDIEKLCQEALKAQAAAICVYPNHVEQSAALLDGSSVAIAAVNNFPHGESGAEEAGKQAEAAIKSGATEIDTVIDYQAIQAEKFESVSDKLRIVGGICHDRKIPLKIIIKASIYDNYQSLYDIAYFACSFCREGDFIKTCTGKLPKAPYDSGGPDSSTLPMSAAVMKAAARYNKGHETHIGVKISGGVKTAGDCAQYEFLAREIMGAEAFTPARFRFGASSLLGHLVNFENVKTGRY